MGTSLALLAAGWPQPVAGAKVFRVGLLMYGKRPGLRDVAAPLGQA